MQCVPGITYVAYNERCSGLRKNVQFISQPLGGAHSVYQPGLTPFFYLHFDFNYTCKVPGCYVQILRKYPTEKHFDNVKQVNINLINMK